MSRPSGGSFPPRRSLGFFPTPLHELPRLAEHLGGPRLLMKRDDLTGLAFGGNKTRKLEFLVADALAQGCDALVTGGAEQSNHCRQTAAAAAACGLACHLALGGEPPSHPEGNLLLDTLLGAQLHWCGEHRKGERIPDIAQQLEDEGHRPYVVPYGGSNTVGALGFVEAVHEIGDQLHARGEAISHLVFASSSGGTHAGILAGMRRYQMDCAAVGIGIDKREEPEVPLEEEICDLAAAVARRLGDADSFDPRDVVVRQEYLGEGYGIVGDAEREAVRLTARLEGILLDPVYTGRAMAGLISLIRRGELSPDDTVVFWHTGGTPAVFSYASDLSR